MVLVNGACVGCGACAMARPDEFAMTRSKDGARVVTIKNSMIHEYVSTPTVLSDALNAANHFIFIPALIGTLHALIQTIAQHFTEIHPNGAETRANGRFVWRRKPTEDNY
jgi:ferredoxin